MFRQFAHLGSIKNHRCKRDDVKNHVCLHCEQSFTHASRLKHHVDSVHPELYPYQCDNCGSFLSSKSSLQKHKTKHTGLKNHQCMLCFKLDALQKNQLKGLSACLLACSHIWPHTLNSDTNVLFATSQCCHYRLSLSTNKITNSQFDCSCSSILHEV